MKMRVPCSVVAARSCTHPLYVSELHTSLDGGQRRVLNPTTPHTVREKAGLHASRAASPLCAHRVSFLRLKFDFFQRASHDGRRAVVLLEDAHCGVPVLNNYTSERVTCRATDSHTTGRDGINIQGMLQ